MIRIQYKIHELWYNWHIAGGGFSSLELAIDYLKTMNFQKRKTVLALEPGVWLFRHWDSDYYIRFLNETTNEFITTLESWTQ